MKIKAFLLTIVVVFSVFCTASCKGSGNDSNKKDREYNEEEVVSAAKDLIKKSEVLNEIYYGHGIECDMGDISNVNGYYFPADILSLRKFGVETLSDIKELTRECFTEAQSSQMINTVLSSVKDSNGDIIFFARYYQEYDTMDMSLEKCIMVYSKYDVLLKDEVEYLYDTVRVCDVDGDIIYVEIDGRLSRRWSLCPNLWLLSSPLSRRPSVPTPTPWSLSRNSSCEICSRVRRIRWALLSI